MPTKDAEPWNRYPSSAQIDAMHIKDEIAARNRENERDAAAEEALAEYAHEAWSGWMRHLFSRCWLREGTATITSEDRARWERQINTPYTGLSEAEKESDRKEARRMLAIMARPEPKEPEVVALDDPSVPESLVPIPAVPSVARPQHADGDMSDGFHTFNELYDYRKAFNALLFNEWAARGRYDVHKSRRHSDGEPCFGGGWFIVVAETPCGQISNHYKDADWQLFAVPERERSNVYDGHTPQIALQRMLRLAAEAAGVRPPLDSQVQAQVQLTIESARAFNVSPKETAEEVIALILAAAASASRLEKAEELSHEHRSPDGDGQPVASNLSGTNRPPADTRRQQAGSEPADARLTETRYAGLVAALRSLEMDLKRRALALTSDRGVMRDDRVKANAFLHVADHLAALVADPPQDKHE